MKKNILLVPLLVGLFLIPMLIRPIEQRSCEIVIRMTPSNLEIPLNQYLVGVISAEIPASFEIEALKAQAVAARTYVLRQTDYGQKPVQITTAHQVFITEQQRQEKWQETFSNYEQKMTLAVDQTDQLVVTKNNQLITAMFHAASHEKTESANNYSGSNEPYLKSVTSTESYVTQQRYTVQQLNELLALQWTLADYKGLKVEYNDTGRVETVKGQTNEWSGRSFREALSLKSTNFQMTPTTEGIDFTVYGYGHGVGLSQYGANELAKEGQNYEEILQHYYPTTAITKIPVDACLK